MHVCRRLQEYDVYVVTIHIYTQSFICLVAEQWRNVFAFVSDDYFVSNIVW